MNDKIVDIKDISTIPTLDGTNYGHWQMRMKIHLRSRDLLEVCDRPCPLDASTGVANKWTKASFEAINLITTRITERVFREVINSETIENSHLLWSKISKQYASKRAVNRGRVWMDWQLCFFDGNLQNYIDHCRKLMMELDAVGIVVPNELLSYSLLGKLGKNSHLNFASHSNLSNHTNNKKETSSSALVTTYDEPHKIIFYCSQGKHNIRCTTHKKEECWAENAHLRPSRREKKRKNNPSAHLSIAQALTTIGGDLTPDQNQVVIDCGATHHMFNSPTFFCEPPVAIESKVATGDAQSHLLAIGLVGPISPESVSGFKFFLTIVYQASSYKIVKFLKRKSDSFEQFLVVKNYMENWHRKKIRKIISDRGGEFVNQKFSDLADKNGMIHILSPPETPEHNGYSERANRTILQKA
ncbi:hypothetical protein O181_012640, partial [Austropuccinia psidii MF-1]|nr:hypothetical protein [Austropuccinia psidii MF-1]